MYTKVRIFNRELLRILSSDPNKEVRKLSLSSLQITSENFSEVLKRLRDSDPELRILLFAKLRENRVLLANLELAEIYELRYQGIYSREPRVRKESLAFFKKNFEYFKEEDEKIEERCEDKTLRSRRSWKSLKNQLLDFLKIFQIKKSLLYPRIYRLLSDFFEIFVKEILDEEKFMQFLTNFLMIELRKTERKKLEIHAEELFLLKIMINSKKNMVFIDENFPSLFEFLPIIEHFSKKKSLFGFFEGLGLAEKLINCEEIGKEKFIEEIREFLLDISLLSSENFPLKNIEKSGHFSDIFEEIDEEKLRISGLMRSFNEAFIVNSLNDIVDLLLRILYRLMRDSNHFIVFVMEIISELKETIEISKENKDEIGLKEFAETVRKTLVINEKFLEKITKEFCEKKGKRGFNEEKTLKEQKEKAEKTVVSMRSQVEKIEKNIERVQMRCLKLLNGILRITPINLKHPGCVFSFDFLTKIRFFSYRELEPPQRFHRSFDNFRKPANQRNCAPISRTLRLPR